MIIMKLRHFFLAVCALFLALVLLGCDTQDDDYTQADIEEDFEQMGDSMEHSWEDFEDFSANQSDAFVDNVNRAADDMEARFDEWGDDMDHISADTREEFVEARRNLDRALDDAGEATEESWDATTDEVHQAWNELEEAFAAVEAEVDEETGY